MIRTRIAPSPTGMLHIGTVRTALFNYVFARANGGEYLVRIEDTDRERSTAEAEQVIKDGLSWLGLGPDKAWVKQTDNIEAHKIAVEKLLASGNAYECFVSSEELNEMRESQKANGKKIGYDGRHRNLTDAQKEEFLAKGLKPVIRFKLPDDENVTWKDLVQGEITYPIKELDDFIIMRADGSPTYNMVVVVDDNDMEITHVIRGDDHINNTPKQILMYQALGYNVPEFAHIPLIHGPDGKKLSKRHGAVSVLDYKEMGYLPKALNNYLMRLGWSMGDNEKFSLEEAIENFKIENVNKGASNFDFAKLDWLNAQYLKESDSKTLTALLLPIFEQQGKEVTAEIKTYLEQSVSELTARAKKLPDLADAASFYFNVLPFTLDEKSAKAVETDTAKTVLTKLNTVLTNEDDWNHDHLSDVINGFIADEGLKFKDVGMPVRVALTGTTNSPSITHLLEVFGKKESLKRIAHMAQ